MDIVIKPVKRTGRKHGGSRKIGRDKKKCERYRASGAREKNKARRIAKEKKRQERFRARREQKSVSQNLSQTNCR